MAGKRAHRKLEAELRSQIADAFPGMSVQIVPSDRWQRDCVTFVWEGFQDLLPEERFHRLARVIPEEFQESHMRGLVWLELAPGETVESFLALPRSEDVVPRESEIYSGLCREGFFEEIRNVMGPSPEKRCTGEFAHTEPLLSRKGFSPDVVQDAKLVFIRHGAYCDCQVLFSAQKELARLYCGAA